MHSKGTGVGPAKHPPKVKSENAFYNSRVLERSQLHIPFFRVLGPFYSGEVPPPFLVEQASQTCWASLSGLLGKPLMLVEQVSWNVMGKSGPSSCRGPTWKDGLYLLWACGYGPIGLANGPIGLTRPYLTFYPLQVLFGIFQKNMFQKFNIKYGNGERTIRA